MKEKNMELLRGVCEKEQLEKLMAIENNDLHAFVAKYVALCEPDNVFVRTDSKADADYIRNRAILTGEERLLATEGHTAHFDGYHDQARDKAHTKYLLRPDEVLGSDIQSVDREEGLEEMRELLAGAMRGKKMYVCFYCLGPADSAFAIPAVQITDSAYVAHSEDMLYRPGYEQFKKPGKDRKPFRFVHSAGRLENNVSVDVDKRRVYIDLEEEMVYSANTQYAGNTVGLKKLAMRLAIKRASEEGWLTEHMFIMGVYGPDNKRKTYFTGSFPSACGKTATAMLEGEAIVGDDIAYVRKVNGKVRAVNVERGIFGIIRDVSEETDPTIYNALTSPGEVIFSNVLVDIENKPRWLSDGREEPVEGVNFSGEWRPGKKGPDDREVPYAHKNARYTIRIEALDNADERLNDPEGVEIGGIIYGGRDSDTNMPVVQSFDWEHGILTQAATIESETTAATLGQEGVRKFNLMANLDFLSIPIGRYIQNNLDMGGGDELPLIFHVNYFLKGPDGEFLNTMKDKHVWVKWMELRVHGEAGAVRTPVGHIPVFDDLVKLFEQVRGAAYSKSDYEEQFKLRCPEHLKKVERIREIYHAKVFDTPHILMKALDEQKKALMTAMEKHGEYISPLVFAKEEKA